MRAAITGASCRLPGANNLSEFWAMMDSRSHGLRHSPPGRYEALELTAPYIEAVEEIGHQWGGYIDGIEQFDPYVFGMSRAEASTADPQHRLILEVVWEALENACETPAGLAGSNTGVFVGLSSFDYAMFQAAFDPYGETVTPFSIPGAAHSIAANRISYLLDLHGPSVAMDAACASSSLALHKALRSLEQGECDTAIVAGANAIMTPYLTKGFKRARMISKDGFVKCFDETTDGYVRAEGAVAIVLRRENDAISRGNRIMGVIAGSAVNHDGKTPGLAAPSVERQVELIQAAHEAAGVESSQVGFVEAHGTGTYRGDETELKALNAVFAGERDKPCFVGSVKANVGHLEATSGLAGVLKAAMCVELGQIPGQANLDTPMPEACRDGVRTTVPKETVSWPDVARVRRAGVSCLGFGGSNSHVVVEQAPVVAERKRNDARQVHVLKLSARSAEQITAMASQLRVALKEQPELALGDICHSANTGRSDFEERAVISCRTRDELDATLAAVCDGRPCDNVVRDRTKRGGRKVGFVYGNGLAFVGMGRNLIDGEPRFARAFNEADEAASELTDVTPSALLYGSQDDDGTLIQDSINSKLAAFSVHYACAKYLSEIGIQGTHTISTGHGGIMRSVLAGEMSLRDGMKDLLDLPSDAASASGLDDLEGAIAEGIDALVVFGASSLTAQELKAAVKDQNVVVASCLDNAPDSSGSFAMLLSTLYASGVDVDWDAYDAPFTYQRLALPTYPFKRERFWFTDGSRAPGVQCAKTKAEPSPAQNVDASRSGAAHAEVPNDPSIEAFVARVDVFEFVRQALAGATAVPVDEIHEKTQLADVEIDSIAGLGLLLQIEKAYGVMPEPDLFGDDMTFGQAIDKLHELVGAAAKKRASAPTPQCAATSNGTANEVTNGARGGAASLPTVSKTEVLAAVVKDEIKPEDYLDAVRPDFGAAMHEMLLDVDFDTAIGDRVSGTRYGSPVDAIDMLGGFGSTLFGHNHPQLVSVLRDALDAKRPMFVQMSNRTAAGTLAKELAARVSTATDRDFNVVFGSTGAEMVDAALKHALFEWSVLRKGFLAHYENAGESAPKIANERPVVLAIEGSFHGKTMGAYSLTWHAPGRDELDLSGPFDVVWLPRDDEEAAREIFERFAHDGGQGSDTAKFNRIAGLFVEPIQGEGGIFPLGTSYVKTLRELADDAGCPIVVDEIQSGMGRTGSFLASSVIGLDGDYYLFGKSLGGGLTKTTALLIDRKRYAEGYGFAHTSTFAEDDHGALVGLRALKLLDEDSIEEKARDAGDYIVERLNAVKERYGDVISDVRGCGLMVGIELAPQSSNTSPLIAGLSDQKLLGIFFTSHLLHRRGVRVGTALSRPSTLRLEPSAYISRQEMDHVVMGIEAVCELISKGNAGEFVRHLAQGYRKSGQTPLRMKEAHLKSGTLNQPRAEAEVAGKRAIFLGHMINSDDIGLLDPSLLSLSVDERENLAARMADPVLVKQVPLTASCGAKLDFQIHSLPLTSDAIVDALRNGQADRIVEQVNTAVEQFAGEGADVIGLGGLLSVITRNGLAVNTTSPKLQITTGNTYTVALAAEAVINAMYEKGIDPETAKVGIVGAGGNIGSTLVQVMSRHFRKLRLVGRKQSISRVEQAARANYDAVLARLRLGGSDAMSGLAAAIADSKIAGVGNIGHSLVNGGVSNGSGSFDGAGLVTSLQEHYGSDPFVAISTNIEDLSDCEVIVTASNAIAPILTPANIGQGTSIICDVSVPSDVDPQLLVERPDITVIRGGVARAPDGNSFTLDMINLPENHMLACMTETALLGFAGKQEFAPIGDIDADGVRVCHELGRKLGFNLAYSSEHKPVPMAVG